MTDPSQNPTGLNFHHVGLLVESISEALVHYTALFGEDRISAPVIVRSQKVRVCFIRIGPGQFLELVEPLADDSAVSGLLKKRIGYYHMAYTVDLLPPTVERMEQLNYKAMEYFESEAFPGQKCIFLVTPEGHLVELIGKVS